MQKTSLVSLSADILSRGKRYLGWFYLLNLAFAWLGGRAFSRSAHSILDHSRYAGGLLHGFDLAVLMEMIARPEFGPARSSTIPGLALALLFFLASLLFMPGVLLGFSCDHRLPREEFFRACGRNLCRFVRLFLSFVLIAGLLGGVLFALEGTVMNALDASSNDDRLPVLFELLSLGLSFLFFTVLRIWFDLAQTDAVLGDQGAVRRSLAWAFRVTYRNFFRLLGTYVLAAAAAILIVLGGILLWRSIVPPQSVLGAFLVGQGTLILLLGSRFWQRAIAVAFYLRNSAEREIAVSSDGLALSAVPAP